MLFGIDLVGHCPTPEPPKRQRHLLVLTRPRDLGPLTVTI